MPETKLFNDLLAYANKVFKIYDVRNLALYYMDEDNDIISVTCQSDFEQAIQDMTGKVKLVIAESEEEARDNFYKGSGSTNTMLQGMVGMN